MKEFPKEFKYGLETAADKKFFQILCVFLVTHIVLLYGLHQVKIKEIEPEEMILKMPERFARLILAIPEVKIKSKEKVGRISTRKELREEKKEGKIGEKGEEKIVKEGGGGDQGEGLQISKTEARTRVIQRRSAISTGVRTKGILGIITGKGSTARGDTVTDVFQGRTEEGTSTDIGSVLDRISGLKKGGVKEGIEGIGGNGLGEGKIGGSRRGTRGSGGEELGAIKDLLGEVKGPKTEQLVKKGEIKIEAPSEVLQDVSVGEVRTSEEIRKIVLENMQGIKYLYNQELKRNPELRGKIVVKFTIAAEGYITICKIVSSTMNCPSLEEAILLRIKRWKFPPITEGEVTVTYPFVFLAEM